MFLQLLGMFAEFERGTIIDRVINGMTAKAGKGKWTGGTRPCGYLVDSDDDRRPSALAATPTTTAPA